MCWAFSCGFSWEELSELFERTKLTSSHFSPVLSVTSWMCCLQLINSLLQSVELVTLCMGNLHELHSFHPFPTSSVFQDEKLIFSSDLIKTNSFCPSSSRYHKNATDKVAKLVTVSIDWMQRCLVFTSWGLEASPQTPNATALYVSVQLFLSCYYIIILLLRCLHAVRPIKEKTYPSKLVTRKGSVLFCFKTGFSLQWGLSALQICSLRRFGIKMPQVREAL